MLTTKDRMHRNALVYLLSLTLLYGLFENGKIAGRSSVNHGMPGIESDRKRATE